VVANGMAGTRHDSNQELVGQGLANIIAPMLGRFAATGAIARTATNICNSGISPLAGIMHLITLNFILSLLAPFAVHIPFEGLAAILFVVAWCMCGTKHFVTMVRRGPRADVAILLITFTSTVFADLVVAVNIGVILVTLHFLRRMAGSVEVRQATEQELKPEVTQKEFVKLPPDVLVLRLKSRCFSVRLEILSAPWRKHISVLDI
jgi:SulP family sulfate permease